MRVMNREADAQMITEQAVLSALATTQDPDLRRDIVSLGFVKGLRIDGGIGRLRDRADDARLPGARQDEGAGAPRCHVPAARQGG
jgi:hypothetical protein